MSINCRRKRSLNDIYCFQKQILCTMTFLEKCRGFFFWKIQLPLDIKIDYISDWFRIRYRLVAFVGILVAIKMGYKIKNEFHPLFYLDAGGLRTLSPFWTKKYNTMLEILRVKAHKMTYDDYTLY